MSTKSLSLESPTTPDATLRVADVETFLCVLRVESVTATARELRVTPSQVSKAIMRLEEYVRRPLLIRRSRGVVATDAAVALLPRFHDIVRSARELAAPPTEQRLLTVAAPSYFAATLMPAVAEALPGLRLRVVEGGESFIRAYAGEHVFHAALTLNPEALPKTWVSTRIGRVRQGFFASPALAAKLGPAPSRELLRSVPFVMPVYFASGQFMAGEDRCPLPRHERLLGHEVSTLAVALEMAAATEQLTFGPELAARRHVAAGRLVEVPFDGECPDVELYLHVAAAHVLAKTQATIIRTLATLLEASELRCLGGNESPSPKTHGYTERASTGSA